MTIIDSELANQQVNPFGAILYWNAPFYLHKRKLESLSWPNLHPQLSSSC